jgi:hypothetical protein
LVEYALVLGLLVTALTVGLQVLQRGATDELAAGKTQIGTARTGGLVAATSTTGSTVPGPTTTSTSSSTTSTTLAPSITASCSAATCTFSVSNPPSGVTSYSWTMNPASQTGTSATFSHTRAKNAGDYTVTVTMQPGSVSASRSVSCTNGNTTTCTP